MKSILHYFVIRLFTLIVGISVIAASLMGATSTCGQQPDPSGWMANEMVPNQPVSISAQRSVQPEPLTANVPADIRAQIGLASFDSPVNVPAPSSTEDVKQPADPSSPPKSNVFSDLISSQAEQLTSPDGIHSSLKVGLLLAALSLAPAIVLMTTCYIRVVVVLSLLKQAFGGQQLPPAQVLTALSLFLTLLIMTPVWNEIKTNAIEPYSQTENGISWDEAWQRGVLPIRNFMIRQIELADNVESVAVFYKYLPESNGPPPTELADVPLNVLLPAFMISELKVAFLLGFQIFLPFLVLDLVVSSVTVSMGMVMLPPNMVSFPLKLILFVMVDGWNLVVGMLLQSFGSLT